MESGGGADANVFNAAGVPCVNLCNGMAEIHTADEWISVADLEAMTTVTRHLIDLAHNGSCRPYNRRVAHAKNRTNAGRLPMRIGVAKEIKQDEYRVALTNAGVRELVHRGHEVLVEEGAGHGSAMSDEDYRGAGASIVRRRHGLGRRPRWC